jgi:DNA polymerase-3 subunit epsilon
MREIVLDTETTGFDPNSGHRVVEIGALELVNFVPTGRHFQVYLDPERDVPDEVVQVHGLTREFLAGHKPFAEHAAAFLEFLGDARLVAHNAAFDLGFINAELLRAGLAALANEVIDTVQLARKRFPGAPASLDALCKRFNIDNSARTFHGALLDAQLLAEVYLELSGGRQAGLALAAEPQARGSAELAPAAATARPKRPHAPSAAELAAHATFLAKLKDPLWLKEDA